MELLATSRMVILYQMYVKYNTGTSHLKMNVNGTISFLFMAE